MPITGTSTRTTPKAQTARFLSIIDTHGNDRQGWEVTREGNTLQVAGWTIECNLGATGPAMIRVSNKGRRCFALLQRSEEWWGYPRKR